MCVCVSHDNQIAQQKMNNSEKHRMRSLSAGVPYGIILKTEYA